MVEDQPAARGLASPEAVGRAAATALWLAATFLAVRAIGLVLARRFERRSGARPPGVLLLVVHALVWAGSLTGLVAVVFGVPLTGAIATSSVLLAVLGFALRSLIADLFYGITMALERPFEIGDWIEGSDDLIGRVDEFNWRAVKLVTRDNVKVVLPNSLVANACVINYDQPDPACRTSLRITLGHEVEADRAKRLLLSAVQQVPESASIGRPAEAVIAGTEGHGVVWELRFWSPDFPSLSHVTQSVYEALLWNLRVAGVAVAREQEELLVEPLAPARAESLAAARDWMRRVPLLAALGDDELSALRANERNVFLASGAELFAEGDEGSSLLLLREGILDVFKAVAGESRRVNRMRPGDVLGELSLLTGAPRSATVRAALDSVLFEIRSEDVQPILAQRPELAERLAEIASSHQQADLERERTAMSALDRDARRASFVLQLATRIRTYFKL
jgi:small-conductance mechanosensitive channel/CRP-like cAMP-binding protein